MQHYDFVSSEAREKFEELVEELRKEMADTFFEGASEALSSMDSEQMARMRDAYDALNRMLEQRERGEDLDPSFEEFMEKFGDMFPGNPQNLDELLEQLAERMAAAQAVWNSLSPEQQAQLRQLMEAVLEDMDLRWQVDRLAQNLQRAFPEAGWQRSYDFQGDGPMCMDRATDLATQLGQLDRMEEVLQSASTPAALGEIDLDQVKQHMGEDAARALDRLANLTKSLADAGLIEQHGGQIELTPRGVRRLGQKALADLFGQINKDRIGDHSALRTGSGHDREETTKAYEYGDPLNLHLSTHGAQRGAPRRLGRPRPAQARGLRGRRGRGPRPAPRPCSASTCPCRCRCATTSCRPSAWRWRSRRSSRRSSHGTSSASSASPRSPARSRPTRSPRPCGTTSTAPTCSTRWRCRGACWRTSTGPSRSSW